jgi:ribosomal protein S18 acetylase RimI-like enzyme
MESFSLAKPEDRADIINITMKAFDEPFSTVEFVFNSRIDFNCCYVCKVGNKIVSVAHAFPIDLKLNSKIFKSYYIYGACTLPQHQGRGYMTRLLEFMEKDLKNKDGDFVFLVPEINSLVRFYEKLGYKNFFKTKTIEFTNDEFKSLCKEKTGKEINFSYFSLEKLRKKLYNNINNVIYSLRDIKFAVDLYSFFGGKVVVVENGYGICVMSENSLVVRDFTCKEIEVPYLLGKIYKFFPNAKKYILRTDPTNKFFKNCGKTSFYGMIKPLKKGKNLIINDIISNNEFPCVGISYD